MVIVAPPPLPKLALNPASLKFSVEQGKSPSTARIYVTNIGNVDARFTLGTRALWMSTSPTTGTIRAGRKTAVYVKFNAGRLGVGTYRETVSVSAKGRPLASMTIFLTVTAKRK